MFDSVENFRIEPELRFQKISMAESVDKAFVEEGLGTYLELNCLTCCDVIEQDTCFCCSCSPTEPEDSTENLFCDVCILTHIRQNHEVFDYKGCKPAICKTHKLPSSLFCQDCDVLLCLKCVAQHCKHDCIPISEKAKEVRKSVFEYLDQFDDLAKPLAREKSFVESFVDKPRQELYPNWRPNNFIDQLCSRFEQVIRANASKWEEMVESQLEVLQTKDEIFDLTEDANLIIQNLRSVLGMSDSGCVSTFLNKKLSIDDVLEQQQKQLQSFNHVDWCERLDFLIEVGVEIVLEKWKVPKMTRVPTDFVELRTSYHRYFRDFRNKIFGTVISENSVSVIHLGEEYGTLEGVRAFSVRTQVKEFNIPGVVAVFESEGYLAFVFPGNNVNLYEFDDSESKLTVQLDSDLKILGFLWNNDHEEFQFLVWSSAQSTIQGSCSQSLTAPTCALFFSPYL